MEEVKDLRELPEIQNIAEYLRGMTFRKKAFGGYDIESVYEHFSAVTLQYEAIISAYMRQVDQYARQLAELQARAAPAVPAAPQPQQQPAQWYAPAPQQQYAYAPQNPWAGQAWSPWAQQPPQGPYAPQPACDWPGNAESLPEPAFPYA